MGAVRLQHQWRKRLIRVMSPAHQNQPMLPSRESLAAFLRERRPRNVDELATILGWSSAEVIRQATAEDALEPGNVVAWHDAAGWLLQAWPITMIISTLGRDADLLPPGLQPTALDVVQPAYIVLK